MPQLGKLPQSNSRKGCAIFAACFLSAGSIAVPASALALPVAAGQVLTLHRSGGVRLSERVTQLVLGDLDYIEEFCRAARLARPAQRAGVVAGFVQSVAVLFRSDDERAREAGRRIRDCCDLIVYGDADIRIQIGVELALTARGVLEHDAEWAEQLNDLVGFCRDEVVETAYAVALGSDRIGLLLGSDVEATQNLGDIQEALSGGGFGEVVSLN